jgi:uncharacterized repeat protein (TIGR02543 family)
VYPEGTSVELTAEAAEGWEFKAWTDGNTTSKQNPLTVTIKRDLQLTAVFVESSVVEDEYTLEVLTRGEGSVTPSGGSYSEGSTVELTAVPVEGWQFKGWTDGSTMRTGNPLSLTIKRDLRIVAVFVETGEVEYTLEVVTNGEGSVTPAGGSYAAGTSVELTAEAAEGWQFKGWTDGNTTSRQNPLTVTMKRDLQLTAVFQTAGSSGDSLTALGGGEDFASSESGANTMDGNNDGIVDSMQDHVSSILTPDGQHYVTIESSDGTILAECMAVDKPSGAEGLPTQDDEYPYGFFAFSVENVEPGGEATVTIYLPADASPTSYYKYGPLPDNDTPQWYDFSYDEGTKTGAKIDGNVITLYFVDGERGDDDLEANGVIVDDGGPGSEKVRAGCFIGTLSF